MPQQKEDSTAFASPVSPRQTIRNFDYVSSGHISHIASAVQVQFNWSYVMHNLSI